MLSEKLGHAFDGPLRPVAAKIPFSPNTLTIAGFLVTASASAVLVYDLRVGGILVIVGGCFDVLDGVVARVNGKRSDFGAFLDSVLDRYSDALIFLAVAAYFLREGNLTGATLSLGSLVGAFLISYARARAEALGRSCRQGLLERPERVILVSAGAILGILIPVLWIMVVLTHFTVAQRIYHVRRAMTAPGQAGNDDSPA